MTAIPSADQYSCDELQLLIRRLRGGDPSVVQEAAAFALADSREYWHGRARANICRYLKNHPPDKAMQAKLVASVANHLRAENLDQQFRDHLKMAIRFDFQTMRIVAQACEHSPKNYIRRCAAWILEYTDKMW